MAQTYSSVTLALKKSTKGTHVYANEERGLTGVYVPRDMLPSQAPTTITMTLSSAEGATARAAVDEESL